MLSFLKAEKYYPLIKKNEMILKVTKIETSIKSKEFLK